MQLQYKNFKFSDEQTFEKARLLGLKLRKKKCMSYHTAERLASEISKTNYNHISQLKFKLQSFCNSCCWRKLGSNNLVNISNTTLSNLEMEALSFSLKITISVKNHDMGKLIDIDYGHHNLDFYKGLYIYIVIHRQTVLLYHNSSVWLDM